MIPPILSLIALVKSKYQTTNVAVLYELLKHHPEPRIMTDLAKAANVSTASITNTKDLMVKGGFLKEGLDKKDRRKVQVTLTDFGLDEANKLFPYDEKNFTDLEQPEKE